MKTRAARTCPIVIQPTVVLKPMLLRLCCMSVHSDAENVSEDEQAQQILEELHQASRQLRSAEANL